MKLFYFNMSSLREGIVASLIYFIIIKINDIKISIQVFSVLFAEFVMFIIY